MVCSAMKCSHIGGWRTSWLLLGLAAFIFNLSAGLTGAEPVPVADDARPVLRLGIPPWQKSQSVDEIREQYRPVLEWYGAHFGTAEIASTHPLVKTVRGAFTAVTGHEPAVEGVTWGSDMRLFTEIAHVPAILFGPGDVRWAHYPNEYIEESELHTAMRVDALAILRWCGIAE